MRNRFFLIPTDVMKAISNIEDPRVREEINRAYSKSLPILVKTKSCEENIHWGNCPICDKAFIESYNKVKYCPNCGQKLIFPKIKD